MEESQPEARLGAIALKVDNFGSSERTKPAGSTNECFSSSFLAWDCSRQLKKVNRTS